MGRGEGRRGLGFGHRVCPVLAHEGEGACGRRRGARSAARAFCRHRRACDRWRAPCGGRRTRREPRGSSRVSERASQIRLGQELELLRAFGSRAAGLRVAVEVHFERPRRAWRRCRPCRTARRTCKARWPGCTAASGAGPTPILRWARTSSTRLIALAYSSRASGHFALLGALVADALNRDWQFSAAVRPAAGAGGRARPWSAARALSASTSRSSENAVSDRSSWDDVTRPADGCGFFFAYTHFSYDLLTIYCFI